MYFGFVRLTFLPDDGCEHEKMKQFTRLQVTSGLSIHCFARSVGFLTQNYNQDLLQY